MKPTAARQGSLLVAAALLLCGTGVVHATSAPQSAPGSTGIDAVLGAARAQSGGDDFLPVDEAFRFDAVADGPDRVRLNWEIADGYYLYRSRLKAATPSDRAQLGTLELPTGQTKSDEYFGRQEVYHHELVARVPVARSAGSGLELPLQVTYQGCADAGLCYPPVTKTVRVSLPPGQAPSGSTGAARDAGGSSGFVSEQDWYASLARSGNIFIMLGGFFLAGLVLAFTPCVLPMVPILAGIIAGHGKNVTTGRAFALSLTYVLGMAFTYTIAGAVCAAAGKQVQAVFQQTWILVLFAALFIALALSMFGLFTLQMPAAVQTRIASISNRQSAGTFGGVAVMGILSALIVTTCVGPALVGALAVISQTGQIVRGAAALFVMSLGMGTPLLLVGASQGRLLPKAGPWMDTVKKLFGVMMLGVAAWMLVRVAPGRAALVLWAMPVLAGAWVLLMVTFKRREARLPARAAGIAFALYGIALIAGSALGGTDPLDPIPRAGGSQRELPFRSIKSVADLEREVARARSLGRTVLVDFYADWCTSCKEMEKYTFTDSGVQAALTGTVLLRADVTDNDADDQALLKRFGIFGPPTIAFYGADGQERANYRVVGYMRAGAFAVRARAALQSTAKPTGPDSRAVASTS